MDGRPARSTQNMLHRRRTDGDRGRLTSCCRKHPCLSYLCSIIERASQFGVPQFIVGRIVNGLGLGILTSTAPPYISECSSAAKRGRNIAIMLTSLIVGINIAYWLNYGCQYISSSVSWRVPLIMQVLWAILICGMCTVLPDSPRWLYLQGRHEDGMPALQALRNLPADHHDVVTEKSDILAAIQLEHAGASS